MGNSNVERPESLAPKALSIPDAGRYLGLSKSSIKKLIKLHRLPAVRLGPRAAVRVLVADLDAFLRAHRDAA